VTTRAKQMLCVVVLVYQGIAIDTRMQRLGLGFYARQMTLFVREPSATLCLFLAIFIHVHVYFSACLVSFPLETWWNIQLEYMYVEVNQVCYH
jgi:hypothetical protein